MQDTLPHIRIEDGQWGPWHVQMSALGVPYAKDAPPSHLLITQELIARSPFVALEEHRNGDKFVEIIGVRFQVIGYNAEHRVFGLRRTL